MQDRQLSPPSTSAAAVAPNTAPVSDAAHAQKKPRKPRESKASKPPAAMQPAASGVAAPVMDAKPLHRPVMVCRRCRTKKIKCDLGFPSCGPCLKANEKCVGLDPATGREVSRSYVAELEDQVAKLNKELEQFRSGKHPVGLGAGTLASDGNDAATLDAETSSKRQLLEASLQHPQRAAKRQAVEGQAPIGDATTGQSPGPRRLVLGPHGVESLPASAHGSSSRQPNTYASGLTPARLLCQAIQQSASAGARLLDSKMASEQKLATLKGRRAMDPHAVHDLGAIDHASSESHAGLKHDSSRSASPGRLSSDGSKQKNSPFDDEAMLYAETTETSDITVPAPEQLLKPSPPPAPFPPVPVARKLVDAYFQRVNPQWPLLDRASFIPRFEAACRDGLARARASWEAQARAGGREPKSFNEDEVEIELQPADGHLFHLVLAIAAAMGWVEASYSAENHHEAAMCYLDPRRASSSSQGVGAIMGRDSLEQLQCLLLTALYSMMRAMKPGIWYCLGVALRLTTGLGLYTESFGLLDNTTMADSAVESQAERKRRLFWCAYSIDRSVGVHLGRPFGIADADIKVNLPWIRRRGIPGHEPHAASGSEDEDPQEEGTSATGYDERASDTSTERLRKEAASTLAALGESRGCSPAAAASRLEVARGAGFPRPKDPSRWVSLSFFRMRILQSEIQGLLFSNAELPRRFDSFEHWKADVLDRLAAWRAYAPSSKEELESADCSYNPIFLELNYRQTLLMVYGISPRFPSPSRSDLAQVEHCSRVILDIYALLARERQMNYTWMTGHSVFIVCTSYLYAIWQISAIYPSSLHSSMSRNFPGKVDEIDHYGKTCDDVLASLQWHTAERCRKCLKTMFAATMGVVEKLDKMIAAGSAAQDSSTTVARGSHDESEKQLRQRQHRQEQQLLPQYPARQHPSMPLISAGPRDRWREPAREGAAAWDVARTSDVRSELQPARRCDSPNLSARSLYSQEPPSRFPASAKPSRRQHTSLPPVPSWPSGGVHVGTAAPHGSRVGLGAHPPSSSVSQAPAVLGPSSTHSRSNSRGSVPYMPDGPGAHPTSVSQQDGRPSWKAHGAPFGSVDGPSRIAVLDSQYTSSAAAIGIPYTADDHAPQGASGSVPYSTNAYGAAYSRQQTGTPTSNAMEFEVMAGAHSSPTSALRHPLGASPNGISGLSPSSTNSPTQLDYSSLMASSAMELDQVFREVGFAGDLGAGGGYNASGSGMGGLQGMGDYAGSPPNSNGAYGASGGMPGLAFEMAGTGNGGVDGGGYGQAGTFTANDGAMAFLGGSAETSENYLENDFDWETVGFGFRINQAFGQESGGGGGRGDGSTAFGFS
ncbi:Fungal specific transcription factor [Thecaphora frezii]